MAEFARARAVRVGPDTFIITGLLVGVLAASLRKGLPDRRASKLAVALLGLLSAALMLAAFPVDLPMLTGGQPETWNGWMHGIAFLLIIATGVLAPLAMALAVRRTPAGDRSGWSPWRPLCCSSSSCSCPGATPHSFWPSPLCLPGSQRPLLAFGRRRP